MNTEEIKKIIADSKKLEKQANECLVDILKEYKEISFDVYGAIKLNYCSYENLNYRACYISNVYLNDKCEVMVDLVSNDGDEDEEYIGFYAEVLEGVTMVELLEAVINRLDKYKQTI